MIEVFLDRFKSGPSGTFGMLTDSTGNLCFTVERPPLGDHPCVPPGNYTFNKYLSLRHGDVWMMLNPPPGRTEIEIHPANDINDLLGCIGVGSCLGVVAGLPAVLHSQDTFKMLKTQLPDTFTMIITSPNL